MNGNLLKFAPATPVLRAFAPADAPKASELDHSLWVIWITALVGFLCSRILDVDVRTACQYLLWNQHNAQQVDRFKCVPLPMLTTAFECEIGLDNPGKKQSRSSVSRSQMRWSLLTFFPRMRLPFRALCDSSCRISTVVTSLTLNNA